LDSQSIVGGVVLIVGKNNGEVINEKETPPSHISVYDGSVMLMPKEEPYLLRNIGKEKVELLVIEVRK
jgi:mannose-6-phosphate isomerase-like protein (cupin superfamily)